MERAQAQWRFRCLGHSPRRPALTRRTSLGGSSRGGTGAAVAAALVREERVGGGRRYGVSDGQRLSLDTLSGGIGFGQGRTYVVFAHRGADLRQSRGELDGVHQLHTHPRGRYYFRFWILDMRG